MSVTSQTSGSFSPSLFTLSQLAKLKPAFRYQGGDFKQWQSKLRPKVSELLGADRWDENRAPLAPKTLWRREHPLGVIEKIVFHSEEGADVTAFVCLPANAKPPYQFVICLQGHTTGAHWSIGVERDDNSKPMEVAGDRDFGIAAMKHGLAALCIEQRSFGERREQHQQQVADKGCHDAAMHGLMLGRPLAGQRVFDVDRGIDYLETRDDADISQLAITGNSGGGTITIFSAAILDRIKYAMPSCGFCTYRDSIMGIYHCADNYIPSLIRYAEAADVLGLAAPRPVIIVAGQTDPIFPIDGVKEAFEDLRRIYAAAGAEDRCRLIIGSEGHRYYADLAWPALLEEMKKDAP